MLRLPCGQCWASLPYSGGSSGRNSMPARCSGGIATMTALALTSPPSDADGEGAVGVPLDAAHDRIQHHARSPSSSAIRSAICWVPPGNRSCCAPPLTSSMRSEPARGLDVAHRVQHRHRVGLATPGHPRHDRHQVARRGARVHVPQPLVERLGCRGRRRSATVHGSATGTRLLTRSNRHWIRDTSSNSMIDSFGIVLRYDRTLPRHWIRFLPLAVGRHRLAAQLGGRAR